MLIGLTGGIASGKSTVSALLVEYGVLLVDADQVARDIVEPGKPALLQIVDAFGEQVLQADGALDRKRLGQIVFSNPDKLKQLEQITHPAIRASMLETFERYTIQQPGKLIVADIPLLYESNQEHLYQGVIVVYVPRPIQIERLMQRNNMTREQAIARIDLQMSLDEKKRRADWVIDNANDMLSTKEQVAQLVQRLGSV